jgi:hypothetical protein
MPLGVLRKIDVFISSPGDVQRERQISIDVIGRLNDLYHIRRHYVLKPLAFEQAVPPVVGRSAQAVVDRYLAHAGQADVFLCILWKRIGTPVTDESSGEQFQSGTEYEFVTAYRAFQKIGRPQILLYRCKRDGPEGADAEQSRLVEEFFQRFEPPNAAFKGLYRPYTECDQFRDQLLQDLDEIVAREFTLDSAAGSKRSRCDFYQHVSRPVNAVMRDEVMAQIRTAVLTDSSSIALTSGMQARSTALHGMGGIGKSAAARSLCDDPQIQAAFPDGILWTTLGQTPDIPTKLREWIVRLGGEATGLSPTVDSLKEELATVVSDRACLLIVDDVWELDDLTAFRVGGPGCRSLITTRDAALARKFGADVLPIPQMAMPEAVKLLEEWARGKLAETELALKERIAAMLARLPLALRLAGVHLQEMSPAEWLVHFESLRDLDTEWGADQPEDSLVACFDLSLSALQKKPPAARLYLTLGIFEEDEPTPQAPIARLWNQLEGLSPKETSRLLRFLADHALLEFRPGEPPSILLHDLLLRMVRERLHSEEIRMMRTALVGAYRQSQLGAGWHTVPDDGYLYGHLARNLAAVDADGELRSLFADQSWLNARFRQKGNEYGGYLNDLAVAWHRARQVEPQSDSSLSDSVRYALIRSSVNSLAADFVPALVGRALELDIWKSSRALSVVRDVPQPGGKAAMYAAIFAAKRLTQAEHGEAELLAVEAAKAIPVPFDRRTALVELLPHLHGIVRERAEEAMVGLPQFEDQGVEITATTDDKIRVKQSAFSFDRWLERAWSSVYNRPRMTSKGLVVELVWGLSRVPANQRGEQLRRDLSSQPRERLERWLEEALSTEWEYEKAGLLSALAPHIPEELIERCLEQALIMWQPAERASVLSALAPRLSSEAIKRCLTASRPRASGVGYFSSISSLAGIALAETADRVAQQALAVALQLPDRAFRAAALQALAPRLSLEPMTRAWKAALGIDDRLLRLTLLRTLIRHFPATTLGLGLEAVLKIPDDRDRNEVLAALAPRLCGELLERAFDAAMHLTIESSQYSSQYERAQVLTALAPQLTGELVERAFDAAFKLPAETVWLGSTVLYRLGPKLNGDLRRRALGVILSEPGAYHDTDRVFVLLGLARVLEPGEVERCFDLVEKMDPDLNAWRALQEMAPVLAGDLVRRACELTDRIKPPFRLLTLAHLLPSMAPDQKARALNACIAAFMGEPYDTRYLGLLLPHLSGEQKSAALRRGLDLIFARAEKRCPSELLEVVMPHLSRDLIEVALQKGLAITNAQRRAELLTAFLPVAQDRDSLLKSIRRCLADHLASLRNADRESVLDFCASEVFVAPGILSPETAGAIADSILDTFAWQWP